MDFSKRKNQNKRLLRWNHQEKLFARAWLYALRVACVAVLIGVFALAGIALGTFMGMLDGVPEVSLESLAITRQSSKIVDQDGNLVTEIRSAEQRTSIPISEMPQDLLDATVAIEDARFYSHNGIDLEGILRAGVANLAAGGTSEGGSTLTQQMIKKMVLTSDQTWKRKIQEWYLALDLEYQLNQEYGKEQTKKLILESYLNYNFLGNNAYGVEAAAERYFGKHAKDMNLAECALIAGLFNAPSAYDPTVNEDNMARERQIHVLDAMLKEGFITQEEYDEAFADPVFARVAEWNSHYEGEQNKVMYSYFVDSVIKQVEEDLQEYLNCSAQEAYNTLYYGGLTIHITQDEEIQSIVDDVFSDPDNLQADTYYEMDYRLTLFDKKDPNITENFGSYALFNTYEDAEAAAAEFKSAYVTEDMHEYTDYVEDLTITEQPQYSMTIIDQHTGHVVALCGGRGEKQSNMGINRAIDSTRQPGSTFKILASYAAALDVGGFGCSSSMDDSFMQWGDWVPNNWWGTGYYEGGCTMREGIANSKNIVTAKFMREVGVETNFDYVEKFGISTLRREADEDGLTDMVGSLCLGSGSVSNIEICGAYATIANAGEYLEPILYTHITDMDGDVLYEKEQESHRTIKETTAYMLADMMRDVVTGANGGTGTACNFDSSMPIAGKTGTTSDANDYSFVGFTPYYTCAIMAGFDYVSYPEIYYESIDGYSIDPAYLNTVGYDMLDSSVHKEIWSEVMSRIHEPLEYKDEFFEMPEGITWVSVCKDSGKIPGPYCSKDPRGSRVVSDMFNEGDGPEDVCDHHVEVTVCKESGKAATKYCPATETKVFVTRTDEEIEEIGAENLSKIEDFKYAIYDVKYKNKIKTSSSGSDKTKPAADYVQKYAVECDLHVAPKEESSVLPPNDNSGVPVVSPVGGTSTPNNENTGG